MFLTNFEMSCIKASQSRAVVLAFRVPS